MVASSGANKLFPNQRGFPTPNNAPGELACRAFFIPGQEDWLALFMGALDALRHDYNYFIDGALSQQEAADAFAAILDDAYARAEAGCMTSVPTPYWDEASETDDEAALADQTWYGYVTITESSSAGLHALDSEPTVTFVENAFIWAFAGFMALSGDLHAAIVFHTIAPKFVLAFKRGSIGEVIKIIVDGNHAVQADTTPLAEGEIMNVNVVGDRTLDAHDILIYRSS